MKNYIQKKQSGGFTIIEVMIVLAVAGLIMLIVFLAVPALQRNSRNTQMRSDAASVLAGVNEFITNNNGSLPMTASVLVEGSGNVVITGAAGSNPTDAKVRSGITVGWAADFDDPSNPAGANIIVLAVAGLCFGSFVNALVWRLRQQETRVKKSKLSAKDSQLGTQNLSILRGRSICP